MLKRVYGMDQREENLAQLHDHRQIVRPGFPPEKQTTTTGLRDAINRLIATCQTCNGPTIELCDDLTPGDLPPELQSAVLPIVKELLLNACRHSKSKNVLLGLAQDNGFFCVQVEDWGIGFDSRSDQPHKPGIKRVRDLVEWLGGTVDIDSERGRGTCVIAEVPLSREIGPNNRKTGPRL